MITKVSRPRAITMWDFSWLERRWPGAGYADWDQALDELAERGYDAVRIDAFPHLISADPDKLWTVFSCGQEGDWGSPSEVDVHVRATLIEFMQKCRERDIAVGLSTWYKRDPDDVRMNIRTPDDQAQIWIDTLGHIERAGLLESVLFVDFCNEFPHSKWAPYLYDSDKAENAKLTEPRIIEWMSKSVEKLKSEYPDLQCTFSFSEQFDSWEQQDVSMLDMIEPHIWMAHPAISDFCAEIGFTFKNGNFQAIVRKSPKHYAANKEKYDRILTGWIDRAAEWSRKTGLPLMTTECWAIVNYRDWPMIDWGWVKEVCELGVRSAAATGRWTAIGTSNFCGPQYKGMWDDIEWHRKLTDHIKSAPLDPDLKK